MKPSEQRAWREAQVERRNRVLASAMNYLATGATNRPDLLAKAHAHVDAAIAGAHHAYLLRSIGECLERVKTTDRGRNVRERKVYAEIH